jgi:hypothetical protein
VWRYVYRAVDQHGQGHCCIKRPPVVWALTQPSCDVRH